MAETGGEEAAAGVDKEVGGERRYIWNQEVEKQQLQKESSPSANAKQAKALDWPQGAQSAMAAASYSGGAGGGTGRVSRLLQKLGHGECAFLSEPGTARTRLGELLQPQLLT